VAQWSTYPDNNNRAWNTLKKILPAVILLMTAFTKQLLKHFNTAGFPPFRELYIDRFLKKVY
jgi:hypothetical protein